MTPKTRLLAWIYIVLCGGCLAIGTVLCVGLFLSHDAKSVNALAMIGGFFVSMSVVYFIPGFVGGLALLRGKTWARTLIIVLSLLVILAIPVGTALGAFGLWVLLGKDANATPHTPDVQHAKRSRTSKFGVPTLSPADRSRFAGLLIAAVGVAAGFVVMIGTGYRVTHTPGSPIGDGVYVVSIALLVLTIVMGMRSIFRHGAPWGSRAMDWRRRQQFAQERQWDEEAHRQRMKTLSADPVRSKYVERIERGEPWSDEQIEYDLHIDQLATCDHLKPIEREMRTTGIEVRLKLVSRIRARCCVDNELLRTRFPLPAFVSYGEPQPTGRAFEEPLPALIACAQCNASIDVVHRADATSDTPLFPSSSYRATVVPSGADTGMDPFVELRSRIMSLARLIDVPTYMIPTYHWSAGTGLPHIEIDGASYHYVVSERGQEFEHFTTTSADELLYRIFRDIAFSMAATPARTHAKPGEDFRREMFRQQLLLLERLNPEWPSRCAAEHQDVLLTHPFVDKT